MITDKLTMTLIVIACIVVMLGLVIYILILKNEMKKISKGLSNTRERGYNKQIAITLLDNDLADMVTEFNKNLDYQKQLKLEQEQAELSIRQSISNISHDLRTPLTVVKGNLQMIEKEETLSPKGSEYFRVCREKCDLLKTMVDEFFELSVLESDHSEAVLADVDVTRLLMQFIIDNEAVIREHGLTPEIDIPEKSIFVRADEDLLNRMFGNLLNNIFKHGEETFRITLCEMQRNENQSASVCQIAFANQVPKNSEFEVERLFERTYLGNKPRTASGAGLGLYIVKLLADKQGAHVYAKQEDNQLSICMEFSTNYKS